MTHRPVVSEFAVNSILRVVALLFNRCGILIERNADGGWRFVGRGLFGILGILMLLVLLVSYVDALVRLLG